MEGGEVVAFGDFELDPARFELRCHGRPIPLERQVFDLLAYLVTARGRVVTKEELLDNVWGTRFVTESALTTQIKFARRALGDSGSDQRYIRTVHRRGYEFVGAETPSAAPPAPVLPERPSVRTALPWAVPNLIGRDGAIADLDEAVDHQRLITIVGPGGVGKTQLALAVATRAAARFRDGVVFVDLATVTDGHDVVRAVAEAGGLGLREGAAVADALAELASLVVIDNCEHLIDAVAEFVERMLARPTDPVRVLATSREPLAIIGERVTALEPLSVSGSPGAPSPAARLFLERAGRRAEAANLDDVERLVAVLEGLPLAVELAAAQLGVMTLPELLHRLDLHRVQLGSHRRRRPRHDSLAANVAWSWELLADDEQRTLTELTVFPGSWGLDAIEGVATVHDQVAVLGRLHAKSLVTSTQTGGTTRFHLLFGVRDYVRSFQDQLPGGADRLRQRMVTWLADWLDEWSFEEQWVSSEFLDLLVTERDTIREATKHGDVRSDPAVARILACSAASFRYGLGVGAGRRSIVGADLTQLPADVAARVRLAGSEASYAFGDLDATKDLAVEAHAAAEAANRSDLSAVALIQQCVGRMLTEPDLCLDRLARAVTHAQHAGARRLEAAAVALAGFCELAAGGTPTSALAVAASADELAAPVGWDRVCVATLRGSAHLTAEARTDAASEFDGIAQTAHVSGLHAAAAMFHLLAVTCIADHAADQDVTHAIDGFRREFNRATGHAGRADALLLLGYRAALRGDTATATLLLDAIQGRRLAHQVSLLILRKAAALAALPESVGPLPTVTVPQSDPKLAALLDEQLATLQ